jgi:hypothetical protein
MKKIQIATALFSLIIFVAVLSVNSANVSADWWQRPTEGPGYPRNPSPTQGGGTEPTVVPTTKPNPTSVIQPTSPVTTGIPTPTTSSSQGGVGGTENIDDPCASGKSYSGPYCGWSPDKDKPAGGNNNTNNTSSNTITPKILGLSRTAGPELTASDIMLFAGILCLSLYIKSKINVKPKSRARS